MPTQVTQLAYCTGRRNNLGHFTDFPVTKNVTLRNEEGCCRFRTRPCELQQRRRQIGSAHQVLIDAARALYGRNPIEAVTVDDVVGDTPLVV